MGRFLERGDADSQGPSMLLAFIRFCRFPPSISDVCMQLQREAREREASDGVRDRHRRAEKFTRLRNLPWPPAQCCMKNDTDFE